MKLTADQRTVLKYLGRADVKRADYTSLDKLVKGSVYLTLNSLRRHGLMESVFHNGLVRPHAITTAGIEALR